MIKGLYIFSACILFLEGCAITSGPSQNNLLNDNQALLRGQTNKGFAAFLAKSGVGKHTEINIISIDGREIPEAEQNQVTISAGQRRIKAMCKLRFLEPYIVGTVATTRETTKISNEVFYVINAEAGGRYQLVSDVDKDGKCMISSERYN